MKTDYHNIIVNQDLSTCTISINREKKLNALNKDTLDELHHAIIDALREDNVKGVILTGTGEKAFVAGADIAEFSTFDSKEGKELAREEQSKVFDVIHQASKPIIAAINGFALGGGLELAMACHIRIAADHALMGLPEVSLGLIPGYGGTQRLTQLVGRGHALEIILTGDMIDANKALSIGLVNYVVPLSDLINKANTLLNKIATRSPRAISAAIRAVNASLSNEGYETEINEFSNLFGTEEFKEGVLAFLEKRKPNF
ncbi:enoyl-CoA hydratase/isomerase family protein [Albibacterium bauzanense]|uniref:Enoyl-CoA hydratase n=1 Tax=Albibacterium bauzanense TaxID=653929 RepID=A0A4R1LWK6_9SPHI|nr:enoyl-CoA hydratase-related protein [Albibacterium bauzanense]TCK83177.1 enoyl-CoA hydratase [Albibacterium bauzanense]